VIDDHSRGHSLGDLVAELDAYFRVDDVEGDAPWGEMYEQLGAPYWREFAEPSYSARWNGLMLRGGDQVDRVGTCVFPSDCIVASLAPRTLLFSEHPLDLDDEPGFVPLSRASFETMRKRHISFYHVHAPLDHHPEVSPSRLCADALGITEYDEFFPIAAGIPGGAAVIGHSDLTLDELVQRLGRFLGEEVPIEVLTRPRNQAGRVALAAGGGAMRDVLEAALERDCTTYVTGNAATRCRLDFVQADVRAFRELADEAGVALVDATHYGTEKPPQRAMAEWFRKRGLSAEFIPGRPERAAT
jgi:putative NIF3 family GTP cyclohydrolase 1 type 2